MLFFLKGSFYFGFSEIVRYALLFFVVIQTSNYAEQTEIGITFIKPGGDHSCLGTSEGDFYCVGVNSAAQLGAGHIKNKSFLVLVPTGKEKFSDFSTHWESSCMRFENGRVKCWGNNRRGQLGLGIKELNIGTVPDETISQLPYLKLGNGKKVTTIAMGYEHACAILEDKTLKCWGDNTYG